MKTSSIVSRTNINRGVFKVVFLDGPAIHNAKRGDSRKSIPENETIFATFEQCARMASNLRFAIFRAPKHDSRAKGFSSVSLNTFRANLRIDSQESGHPSGGGGDSAYRGRIPWYAFGPCIFDSPMLWGWLLHIAVLYSLCLSSRGEQPRTECTKIEHRHSLAIFNCRLARVLQGFLQ